MKIEHSFLIQCLIITNLINAWIDLKLEDEYRLEKKYAREEILTLENKAKSISQIQEAINILKEMENN